MSAYQDEYQYIAVFDYVAGQGATVTFPDVSGCISTGESMDEAYKNAHEALKLHLYNMEQDGDPIPSPSSLKQIENSIRDDLNGKILIMIRVYMPPFRDAMKHKVVKKTLTIPQWLNEAAEKKGINFSQVLTYGLKKELGIED